MGDLLGADFALAHKDNRNCSPPVRVSQGT
jgi:hypothetical protein